MEEHKLADEIVRNLIIDMTAKKLLSDAWNNPEHKNTRVLLHANWVKDVEFLLLKYKLEKKKVSQ